MHATMILWSILWDSTAVAALCRLKPSAKTGIAEGRKGHRENARKCAAERKYCGLPCARACYLVV